MAHTPTRASLIVTTYNRPDALAAVLRALRLQRARNFEVVVADDGSRPDTAELLTQLIPTVDYPLRHVWQEDQGFRAGRARNLAVAASTGDYLVFLDGDCIPFPDFVGRHLGLAERGWFVSGNRVMFDQGFTARVLKDEMEVERWEMPAWIRARLAGSVPRLLPLLRFPHHGFKRWTRREWYGAKSCNLAVWREDFMAVNGFDEAYSGWGHEDADLVARLIGSGVYRKSGRFAVPVMHLWHPHSDRAMEPENMARLQETLQGRRDTRAGQGVASHLQRQDA